MHFAELNRYQIGFFIVGQSTIVPGKIRFRFILRWIPILIHFCLIVCFFKFFAIHTLIRVHETKFSYLLYGISIMITSISSIIMNLILPCAAQNLIKSCIALLNDLEKMFGVPFEWRYFVNSFNITILLSLIAFTLAVFGRFIHSAAHLKPGMDTIILTMNFFEISTIDYVVFHVALYSLILHFLNFNLKRMAELNHLPKEQLRHILSYVSKVHQRLWSISIAIEHRFGWQLLAILFESFINLTHTVYSTFWYLDSCGQDSSRLNTIVLRNFFRLNNCILFYFFLYCILCTNAWTSSILHILCTVYVYTMKLAWKSSPSRLTPDWFQAFSMWITRFLCMSDAHNAWRDYFDK